MTLSDDTQAILLLTARFPQSSSDVRPLTPTEWGTFAEWLHANDRTPADLFTRPIDSALAGWSHKKVTLDRVQALMERGQALALAVEKWLRSGLWVLTRQDPEYPRHLKRRLGRNAPPVLFGAGDRSILRHRALAVVGSRTAGDEDLEYAKALGKSAAEHCRAIVSGGAKGIDEAAMLGALEHGGFAVGVLAEGLQRASSSQKFRRSIREERLVLLSPFSPEARFNTGNAMQRNKYIYCLSEASVVVHSGTTGGTWTGAKENLKKRWVPLWVKPTEDPEAGNGGLIEIGGRWAPASVESLNMLALFGEQTSASDGEASSVDPAETIGGTSHLNEGPRRQVFPSDAEVCEVANADGSDDKDEEMTASVPEGSKVENGAPGIYAVFLCYLERVCENEEVRKDDLVERIQEHDAESELTRRQVENWIKKAVLDGFVSQQNGPVRYRWTGRSQQRLAFD